MLGMQNRQKSTIPHSFSFLGVGEQDPGHLCRMGLSGPRNQTSEYRSVSGNWAGQKLYESVHNDQENTVLYSFFVLDFVKQNMSGQCCICHSG